MARLGGPSRRGALLLARLLAALLAHAATEPTIDQLKARVETAGVGDKPKLCVQIAQRQLTTADKLYIASENEKGQVALNDTLTYSESARDYAIKSHKYEKQTEIAMRGMIRKLNDMLHTLSRDEQGPIKDAIGRLQRVRDDLLQSMFPKGGK
jgi:hypothetical protein